MTILGKVVVIPDRPDRGGLAFPDVVDAVSVEVGLDPIPVGEGGCEPYRVVAHHPSETSVDQFGAVGGELALGRPALVFDRGVLHVVDETMNEHLEPIVTVVGDDRDVRTADMVDSVEWRPDCWTRGGRTRSGGVLGVGRTRLDTRANWKKAVATWPNQHRRTRKFTAGVIRWPRCPRRNLTASAVSGRQLVNDGHVACFIAFVRRPSRKTTMRSSLTVEISRRT